MGMRKETRLRLACPVRVSCGGADGEPIEQDCTTVDLTVNGLRIEGLLRPLRRGAVASIGYGGKTATARVMWSGEMGTEAQGHSGLQVIGGWKNLWSRTIPQIPGDGFSKRASEPRTELVMPRHPGDSGPVLRARGATDAVWQVVEPEKRIASPPARVGVQQRMLRDPRLKLKFPVRVCGMSKTGHSFIESVITENVSRSGVSLTGLAREVKKNETLILSNQERKGRFRVIWSRQHGARPVYEIGLRSVDLVQNIWAIDFSGVIMDECGPVERRVAQRYVCSGGVSIYNPSTKQLTRGIVSDLSMGGCYIEMLAPLGVRDRVSLAFKVNNTEVHAVAEVRASHPGMGMGLKFREMPEADRSNMHALVSGLGYSGSGRAAFVLKTELEEKSKAAT